MDHIVLLVHKVFTVTIPKPDIEQKWLGHTVEIGQEVKCCVTQLDRSTKPPSICATFNSDYLQGCRLPETYNNIDYTDTDNNIDNSDVKDNIQIVNNISNTKITTKIKQEKNKKITNGNVSTSDDENTSNKITVLNIKVEAPDSEVSIEYNRKLDYQFNVILTDSKSYSLNLFALIFFFFSSL